MKWSMYPLSSEIHLKNQNVGMFRTNEKIATEIKHIMAILKLIALERQTAKYLSNAKTTTINTLAVWEIKAIGARGRMKWAKYLKGSTANEEKALTDIQQRAVVPSKTAKPKIFFHNVIKVNK